MNIVLADNKIRELLNPSNELVINKKELTIKANDVVKNILSSKKSLENYNETKSYLTTLYDNLKGIFDFAQVPIELRDRQFLNKTGFAMSPTNAITTINDVFRVSGFIRAIDLAIIDLKKNFEGETLHIVYPACGPLAPLLVPLLVYYNSNNIYTSKDFKVTFIDIQEGAIISLVSLLNVLELDDFVKDILCIDAVDYKSKEDIHLVILEAMQHGFTKEGHLSISKHFAELLHEKGVFLPQEVSINAVITTGEEEYNQQWEDVEITSSFGMKTQKRVPLGEILKVKLTTLREMKVLELDENTRLIECASYRIPALEDNEFQWIMLFTTNVVIYKDEVLNEYDTGITHPLPDLNICINFIPKNDVRPTDLYIKSGEMVSFYYKLVGLPGFLVTKGEEK